MVITLTGSNSFARGAFLVNLKKEFIEKHGADGAESYTGEQLTPEVLASALGGVSLFATHRLVVIRDLSLAKSVVEQFVSQIKHISEEVTIVLVEASLDKRTSLYKTLKKDTEFHEFTEMSDQDAIRWIEERVKQEGGSISRQVAQLLFVYCGSDQSRLAQEIAKLVAYEPAVTKESVELLVDKNPRDTIFELLELAMSGKSDRAIQSLLALEGAHEDPFQIASMLIWQAHILAAVQTASDRSDGEIAKDHKINPYVVSKTKRLTQNMSTHKLSTILDTVAQLDIALKSNVNDPWRALEHTVLALY
ncbi:DNA polymerase III subunit delta [Candidatus Saccharibacteria bacterium]|nr:DNA polymerase III subunit delta [Candidatus Saccharibacteria bacterium]